MKRILSILSVLLLLIGGTVARAAILPNPSDYGATIQPASYSLSRVVPDDGRQGQTPDCWWWAAVDAVAHQNPAALSRNYAVNADGTVTVTFFRQTVAEHYTVTPDISTWYGDPSANVGSNGDATLELLQKAFATYRTSAGTMAGLGWGFPSEAWGALGLNVDAALPRNVASIKQVWDEGFVAAVNTGWIAPPNAPAQHSLAVWGINPDGTVLLYNPWGDGYANYPKLISVNDAWLNTYATSINVADFGGASPVPEPASAALLGLGCVGLLRRKRRAA